MEPHDAAVKVLAQGMIDCKLLKGSLDGVLESGSYRRFYMHRTGHWLGRDVHDCGDYREPDAGPAQAGSAPSAAQPSNGGARGAASRLVQGKSAGKAKATGKRSGKAAGGKSGAAAADAGRPWRRLVPGMVTTIEPGIYVRSADDIPKAFRDIGIRIEDDALVTIDGCELITSDVPKDPADIEALMADARRRDVLVAVGEPAGGGSARSPARQPEQAPALPATGSGKQRRLQKLRA
jgi:Xaa-Pro aminopeptidase